MFNSRSYATRLKHNFSFNARDKLFFVSFLFLYLLKNFCAQSPCENYGTCQSGFTRKRYIDVYVRLDLMATIVKKVTLKLGEFFFPCFNTVVYFFRESLLDR